MMTRARPLRERYFPALANFHDAIIVVSGGLASQMSNEYLKSVDLYDVKTDIWSTAPSMNTTRTNHSSCCLGDFVYVAGGTSDEGSE